MCEIKRVRYEKCPLIEVTYQLNFPTILSIEAEMPVRFQNAIRKDFPEYKMQTEQEGEAPFINKDKQKKFIILFQKTDSGEYLYQKINCQFQH